MDPLSEARSALAAAAVVCFVTGAGVSAASGVPTFRGAGGLWRRYRPEQLATPQAFADDPVLVWQWYAWRRRLIAGCRPNPAHHAIGAFLQRCDDAVLITQNVDGLHEAAAAALGVVDRVLRFHGSIWRNRCSRCGYGAEDRELRNTVDAASLPRCPDCRAPLRPDVVWFGERIDPPILEAAWTAAESADVVVVAGTSGQVEPASSLAQAAKSVGARLIEINPESGPLSALSDWRFAAGAETVLPELLA